MKKIIYRSIYQKAEVSKSRRVKRTEEQREQQFCTGVIYRLLILTLGSRTQQLTLNRP